MRMLAVTMVSAATLAVGLHGQGPSANGTVDAHVAAAKAAAGQDHSGLFNAACAPASIRPVPAAQRGQGAGGAAARPGPPVKRYLTVASECAHAAQAALP